MTDAPPAAPLAYLEHPAVGRWVSWFDTKVQAGPRLVAREFPNPLAAAKAAEGLSKSAAVIETRQGRFGVYATSVDFGAVVDYKNKLNYIAAKVFAFTSGGLTYVPSDKGYTRTKGYGKVLDLVIDARTTQRLGRNVARRNQGNADTNVSDQGSSYFRGVAHGP